MKILYFFLFLWVIYALLRNLNVDPDPDPATQIFWENIGPKSNKSTFKYDGKSWIMIRILSYLAVRIRILIDVKCWIHLYISLACCLHMFWLCRSQVHRAWMAGDIQESVPSQLFVHPLLCVEKAVLPIRILLAILLLIRILPFTLIRILASK